MNKDPYSVLGVSRDATEEQIKAAYRELARKYHPDNYSDNPLSDLAEDKMSEINEAYDAIMQERRAGKSASGTGTGGASYRGSTQYADVRSLINSNRIEEALELLDGVPPASRNAEWYFLNGSVLYRQTGLFENTVQRILRAVKIKGDNTAQGNIVHHKHEVKEHGKYRNGPFAEFVEILHRHTKKENHRQCGQ